MENLNGIKKCNRILAMTCAIILFMSSIMPLYAIDSTSTINWDKTLFIGDSITVGLGQTCNLPMYMATVGDSPSGCLKNINSKYSMPEESQVDKVVLMIGVNGVKNNVQNQLEDTKKVIERLQELYPDKTIYVQGILPRAENGKTYTDTVDNQDVATYNEELKNICEGITNVQYIDTSTGLVEDIGGVNYLKEEYTADGLHLLGDGYKKLLENIDSKIKNGGTDNSNSSIAKRVSPYKMTIAINEDERVFELTYSKYNEERAEKLKEQFEKRNLEELYNKILEKDKEDGIDYKDNNGRLAILASFVDNGLDVTQLTEDLIEMFPEFIKAELLSTYPDIREKKELTEEIKWDELNIGEFQGIVRLKRKHVEKESNGNIKLDGEGNPIINDKSEEYLEYIKKEDFDKLKKDKKEEILDYFTMDKDCSYIIVGKVSKNNGDITISEQKINYRPTVNNFAMSFELLEAFYAVTRDTKLIKEMTDLAYNGTIEIAVLENTTITDKTTREITEVAQGKIIKKGDDAKYGDLGPYVQQSETYTTERNISTTYSLKIDKADTWVCSMKQLYKPKYQEEYGSFGELSYGDSSFSGVNDVGDIYYHTRVGHSYKTDTFKVKWEKDGEVKEHIKIKDDDGKWEGLLAVLGRRTLFTGKYVYADSISSIYSADLWIFGMLEDAGSSTAQVNLIKYMFYEFFSEYYGIEPDYGVTEPPSFKELFGDGELRDAKNMYSNGKGFWWPIGSEETTVVNGKTFASGDPALGLKDVSRAGNETSKYHGYLNPPTHPKPNGGSAVDIAGGGITNKWNIIAIAKGEVIETGDGVPDGQNPNGLGNYVIIDHGNGYVARYLHLYIGSVAVKEGDIVDYGQVIGKMGTSGNSTGVHLHIDISLNGTIVDTTEYIDPDNPRPVAGEGAIEEWLWKIEGGESYINGNIWTVFNPSGSDNTMNLAHGMVVASYNGGDSWYPDILPGPIYEGQTVTEDIANQIWEYKITECENAIDKAIAKYNVTVTSYQRDAFISLIYRTGNGNNQADSVVKAYKEGGEKGVWIYMSQRTNPGYDSAIKNRLAEEFELFLKGDYNYEYTEASKYYEFDAKYNI